jgi:hypothetical protein
MQTNLESIWRGANVKRVLAIGAIVAASAFFLLLFLASLGDSDLPPYDPPFPGERAGWLVCQLLSWPLVLAALILRQKSTQPRAPLQYFIERC